MNKLKKILFTLCLVTLLVLPGASVFANSPDGGSALPPEKAPAATVDENEKPYNPNEVPKTLIPKATLKQQGCFNLLYKLNLSDSHDLETLNKKTLEDATKGLDGFGGSDGDVSQIGATEILGCAIKTGMFRIWMLPIFLKYIIDFLLSFAGLVAVLFVVIGGYIYMFGGLAEDKERGKKAIMYGVLGFVVALLAWVVVNAVQILVTS